MSKTESVLFKLGADVSGLTKGLAQGRKGLKDVEDSASSLTGKLVGLAGVLGVGIGFASAAKEALQFADSVTKLSEQTGLSVEAVQRLAFFASQTGNSLEQVTGAVGKMQENLVKGAEGSAAQAEAFQKLHISAGEFLKLDPETQFRQVSEAIAGMTNPADQAAAAVSVFGKSGKEVIPLMEQMTNQGDELNAAFEKMGGPMSADTVKALDDIGDQAIAAGQATRNFAGEILALASPAIIAAMSGITEFFGALKYAISAPSSEMEAIGEQMTDIQNRIARGPGFRQPAEAWAENKAALEGELALLRAKAVAIQNSADAEALARSRLAKLAGPTAEELPVITVHDDDAAKKEAAAKAKKEEEDAKTAAILKAQKERLHEQGLLVDEFDASEIDKETTHQSILTQITKDGYDARSAWAKMSAEDQTDYVVGKLADTLTNLQRCRTFVANCDHDESPEKLQVLAWMDSVITAARDTLHLFGHTDIHVHAHDGHARAN